ncbi:MAG: hypothetical protein AAGK66_10520 [Pseudomonadota bacterium]
MQANEITTPFGDLRCLLAVKSNLEKQLDFRQSICSPELEDGLRVDGCVVGTCSLKLLPSEQVDIGLTVELKDGFFGSQVPTEHLDAIQIEGPFFSGAYGMRDDEYLAYQDHIKVRYHHSGHVYRVRLSAEAPVEFKFQFAAAWTQSPQNTTEHHSPIRAIDLAMTL